MALEALGDAMLALLGSEEDETAMIRVDGREKVLPVVFRKPSVPGVVGRVPVLKTIPEIMARGADWDTVGGHVGAFITIRGREFVIASFTRDDADIVEAALRESR